MMAFVVPVSIVLAIGVYLLLNWLFVRRVVHMQHLLVKYADGDFKQRLPEGSGEIGDLAVTFNDMAQRLDDHERSRKERVRVRQRAIVEERERIARELHDGMAQLLGYVNTKAMAVRVLLKNKQIEQADQQLGQLEDATRGLFVDVREAILGLKMAGHTDGLIAALKEYVTQFSRLSDLPVDVSIAPDVNQLTLAADIELQLLRIVQEALTNIRKHAAAQRAAVGLKMIDGHLELTISDNGKGFDPEQVRRDSASHFGLSTMRERAEVIGAEFQLDSKPNAGTRLTIRVPFREY